MVRELARVRTDQASEEPQVEWSGTVCRIVRRSHVVMAADELIPAAGGGDEPTRLMDVVAKQLARQIVEVTLRQGVGLGIGRRGG